MRFLHDTYDIDVYSLCESVYYSSTNDEYDYVLECINNWIYNDYNDNILIESIVLNEISTDWIEHKLKYYKRGIKKGDHGRMEFTVTPDEKKNDLIIALMHKNDINRNIRNGLEYDDKFKTQINTSLQDAIYDYRNKHHLPDARTRNKTINKRVEIPGVGKRRLSQLRKELDDHIDSEDKKTDALYKDVSDDQKGKIRSKGPDIERSAEARFKSATGQDYDPQSHYHVLAMKNIYSELYREERDRIRKELDKKSNTPLEDKKGQPAQPKSNTSQQSTTNNNTKSNGLKTWHKAAIGAGAAAAVGAGIYAYKQYKNKPKSVIGKRIAALRGIYRKFMTNAQRNPQKANIFKRIAARILSVIDKLMGYLQNAAG